MLVSPYDALVERLTDGILATPQRVTMVLGSAVSAPMYPGGPGVYNTSGIVRHIEETYFSAKRSEFSSYISASDNSYISAFEFLIPRRGQNAANSVVRSAVWNSRAPHRMLDDITNYKPDENTAAQSFLSLEADWDSWYLTPALTAIGTLASTYSDFFGHTIITTNFDPLIEIGIRRSGGHCFRSIFHRDGNLGQAAGEGTNIAHLHGYWWGSDTLHTQHQLMQNRPRLKASLGAVIRNDPILVCGYGGWDDVFNSSLADIVNDDGAYPEVLWALHGSVPSHLEKALGPLIDRGRVTVYSNVDCNRLFPDIVARLSQESPRPAAATHKGPIFIPSQRLQQEYNERPPIEQVNRRFALLGPSEDDRPPTVDFYVGRDDQLAQLVRQQYDVCYITGIGGQGKSALAATFFNDSLSNSKFEHCVWRDCKEEAERFETQVVRIVVALSGNTFTFSTLSKLSSDELFTLFIKTLSDRHILFVFDNVDHYVDMEHERLVGSPACFVEKIIASRVQSKFLFTCRGNIRDTRHGTQSIRLVGLDLNSTIALFGKRSANSDLTDIEFAHGVTEGHALWLDLLAAQVATHSEAPLRQILSSSSEGSRGIPMETLQSIWNMLREREQTVLRTLAECVRPTTEVELASFLEGQLNFNKVGRALSTLRSLNLIVVKSSGSIRDHIELHPVVKEFIKKTFSLADRRSVIDIIIDYYERFFAVRLGLSRANLTVQELQNWVESIELHVSAGKFDPAFNLIGEVLRSGLYQLNSREFVRVCGILFSQDIWANHSSYEAFDRIATAYTSVLADLGRVDEARRFLAQYRETIEGKSARYINYCDMFCYLEWVIGEFKESIKWGEEGDRLKSKANTDTVFDSRHNLALARRDSGDIDPALTFFLKGRAIEAALDPDDLDEKVDGSYYGNIGRCLQLMGQVDTALVCYRKSALLIEKDEAGRAVSNRGYVRQWIGEVFATKNALADAAKFLKAAMKIWEMTSPVRESRLMALVASRPELAIKVAETDEVESERYCVAWFFGRESDL